MKGYFYGLKSSQISLFLISFMCITFFLWAWEKSPTLSSFIPSHNRLLQISPDMMRTLVVNSVSVHPPHKQAEKDTSSFSEKETVHNQESFTVQGPAVSGKTSHNLNNEEKVLISTSKGKRTKDEHFGEAETYGTVSTINTKLRGSHKQAVGESSKQKHIVNIGLVTGSSRSSYSGSKEDNKNLTVVSEIQGKKTKYEHIREVETNGTISTINTKLRGSHEQVVGESSKQKHVVNIGLVTGSSRSSYSGNKEDNKNLTVVSEIQACNYAKGKWVADNNRPLYSGFGCKKWLAEMWACRLTQRRDFSFEKIRWQPSNCQMDDFEGSKFLTRMQHKTLAFVGDSLGRQQFQSLMCMITGGTERGDAIDVGEEFGLIIPPGGARPNGWAYRFPSTNTTILYYWSASLCGLEPIDIANPATDYALHLDRPPAFLCRFLHKIDVLVLNTGHHWNRGKFRANRWVMHVGGVPNTDKRLVKIGDAKNFTIHSIIKWVNSQLPKHPGLKAFYRSISPRHFVNGDWNTGGSCDNTTPMSIGKEIFQDESDDYSAASAVKGTGVNLLDITAISQLRDEGHMSRFSIKGTPGVQDCLHWCLPGVPDTWNELLFAQIQF